MLLKLLTKHGWLWHSEETTKMDELTKTIIETTIAKNAIHLSREFILTCAAEHYNIDINKTNLLNTKDKQDYIQVTWDAQTE